MTELPVSAVGLGAAHATHAAARPVRLVPGVAGRRGRGKVSGRPQRPVLRRAAIDRLAGVLAVAGGGERHVVGTQTQC